MLCPVGSGIVRALFKEDEASPIEDFRPDCVLGTLAFKAVSFKANESRLVMNILDIGDRILLQGCSQGGLISVLWAL